MKKLVCSSRLAVAIVLYATVADVHAASISLRRGSIDATFYPGGYTGAADSNIFYFAAASGAVAPAVWMRSADGGNNHNRSGAASSSIRTLYRFDLSGMTGQGVVATSNATLTFTSGGGNTGALYKLFQIAPANAGWMESTNNITLFPSSASFPNKSNQGDPTFWYKSIDNATYAATTGFQTSTVQDTTSVKWASGHANQGAAGSNPDGNIMTGGLWNTTDLVDQNPLTVATDVSVATPLGMNNMDPVAQATLPAGYTSISFTIPQAMIQSWIDNPGSNAGLLGRYFGTVTTDFNSQEIADANLRPTLSFEYVVPEPASWSLMALGAVAWTLRRRSK